MMIHDQPVSPLPGHIRPHPLQKNAQTEARRGEELEVHRGPSEPSREPAYLDFAALQHSKTFADYRHAALVKVAKWTRKGTVNNATVNQLSRITPLLHCHLSNAW